MFLIEVTPKVPAERTTTTPRETTKSSITKQTGKCDMKGKRNCYIYSFHELLKLDIFIDHYICIRM